MSTIRSTVFVADIRRIGPKVAYQPEKITFGSYTFVPWVRNGLAAQLTDAAGPNPRATVAVTVTVQDDAGGSQPVTQSLVLRGPSDVLALDPGQIVRRYPAPASLNAEPNYLAHVEFDRPELPWLFTPIQPRGDRLAPWLALVVVEESQFTVLPGPPGLPERFTTRKAELQPLDDSWAWAHAQVVGPVVDGASVADRLTADYGPVNLSRLLCPRRLDPERGYVACLVPAFDCSARAGLGLSGGTLGPAWTRAQGDDEQQVTLPLYDRWSFRTAPAGDFESLARKLRSLPAPWTVGRRLLDCANPRGGLAPLAPNAPGRVQVFKCALSSPAPAPQEKDADELRKHVWDAPKREELRARLNEGDKASKDHQAGGANLPRVNPRLYAQFQRGQSRVEAVNDTDWFNQLNTTPTLRVAAGLGTRVVGKDREQLMQAAWAQVGEVNKANLALALAQFARFAGAALHQNHLSRLPLGDFTQITRAVQGKVRMGGEVYTVAGAVARSATAPAALTGAFRRMTRLRGPLTRFLAANGAAAVRGLVAAGDRFQDFRRQYAEPDGIKGLSAQAVAQFSPELIGRTLNVPQANAVAALQKHAGVLAGKPTVADQLMAPRAQWRVPAGNIDLGQIGASRLLEKVQLSLPQQPAQQISRTESLAGILVGIAHSNVAVLSTKARDLAESLGPHLGPVLTPAPFHPAGAVLAEGPAGPAAEPAAVPHAGPVAGVVVRPEGAVGGLIAAPRAIPVMDRIDTIVSRNVSGLLAAAPGVPMQQAASAFGDLTAGVGVLDLVKTPDRPQFGLARTSLLAALDPKVTVTAYVRGRLGKLPSWLPPDWFDDGWARPIMAAPAFTRPMYEALDAYDREWLVPGLGAIQEANLVTLLETNPAFNEAFLVGLSDEMGRELLWRGYPTDQRGTYFQRFWGADRDELSQPIHQFSHTPLGSHLNPLAGGSKGRVVLVVRGELIRRYPDAIMMAMRQIGTTPDGHPVFADPAKPGGAAGVLFHVPLRPDTILTAFQLTVEEVRAQPWWFVLAEHPTASRFGLEPPRATVPPSPVGRDQATWDTFGPLRFTHFLSTGARAVVVKGVAAGDGQAEWGTPRLHGGAVACALVRDPYRAAFAGWKLIAPAHQG
jgi:hypothetical protein